jgi:hypothetical protein
MDLQQLDQAKAATRMDLQLKNRKDSIELEDVRDRVPEEGGGQRTYRPR